MSTEVSSVGPKLSNTITPREIDPETLAAAKRVGSLVQGFIEEFSLPWEEKNNSCSAATQEHTLEWINTHNVFSEYTEEERKTKLAKIKASKFGDFIGRCHPRATEKILNLIADFGTWLFLYDDMIEKCTDEKLIKTYHARTISILNGSDLNKFDDPLTSCLHDIVKRINGVSKSTFWKIKFIKDVQDYCDATIWELGNRTKKQIPSLEDYKKWRPDTSGTKIMFDFFELVEEDLVGEFDIPPEIFEHEYFQKLRLLGANLVNWENDLLSAPKEIINRDIHNLVFVYKNEKKDEYEEAFAMAYRDLKEDLQKFLEHTKNVPDFGIHTEKVKAYIKGIQEWLKGHHDWAKVSPRYPRFQEEKA